MWQYLHHMLNLSALLPDDAPKNFTSGHAAGVIAKCNYICHYG